MAATPLRSEEQTSGGLSCCLCLGLTTRVHPSQEDHNQDHVGDQETLNSKRAAPTPVQTQPAVFQPTDTPVPGLGHVTVQPSAPIPETPAAGGTGHHHGNQEPSLPSAPIPEAPASNDDGVKGTGHHHGNQEQEGSKPSNTPEPEPGQATAQAVDNPSAPVLGAEETSDEESDEHRNSPIQGTFGEATGVAVSEEGEIFVADKGHKTIQVFTLQGTFVREFPTVVPDEEKMEPLHVAVDGEGNLWVVGQIEIKNGTKIWNRNNKYFVVQYNKQGKVLRKFDLKDTGTGCYGGVAMDTRRNHILVTRVANDKNNKEERERNPQSEVQVFRPDGTLVRTIKIGQQLTMEYSDTGTGYITVEGEGNILVTDEDKHCVYVYNEDGQFLFQFGGLGSGEGHLYRPRGICTDMAGNIIVADHGNGRVEMFDKTGKFIKHITKDLELSGAVAMATQGQLVVIFTYKMDDQFFSRDEYAFCVFAPELDKVTAYSIPATLLAEVASHQENERKPGRITFAGSGKRQGKLDHPVGVAVSEEGEIFVAEENNPRIQVFTLQGTFVRQFPTVVAGEQEMATHHVAMDKEGNLWAVGKTDSAEFAVQYDKQGRVLRKFDLQETGQYRGVAVDTRRNHILITQTTGDEANPHSEVLVFRPDGTLVRTVGQQQGMKFPVYVTVDGEGNILLSDQNNHCVYVYNEDGQFLFKFGDGESDKVQVQDEDQDDDDESQGDGRVDEEGQLYSPIGICTDSLGNIIVADVGDISRVEMWDNKGKFLYRIFEEENIYFLPYAVVMTPQGQLVVTSFHDKITVFDKGMVAQSDRVTFGGMGRKPGQFNCSTGVAVSEEGEIFVADHGNARIQVFTLQGTFVRQFPTVVPGEEEMEAHDVALDGEGNLWVVGKTDSADFAVQYNKQGSVLRKFDLQKTGYARGVAVDTRRNHILITQTTGDWENPQGEVLEFRPDGTLVTRLGGIKYPQHITVDAEWNILVSVSQNVHVYSGDGQFLFKFGGKRSGEGRLNCPRGICTDRAGNIIVADSGNKRVVMFDKTGRFIKHIAAYIICPWAVAIAPQGQLVVTSRHTVNVFEKY